METQTLAGTVGRRGESYTIRFTPRSSTYGDVCDAMDAAQVSGLRERFALLFERPDHSGEGVTTLRKVRDLGTYQRGKLRGVGHSIYS